MKKSNRPETKVKNKPNISDPDWIVWAAWADKLHLKVFEKTGKSESDVIKIMRRTLKTKSFKLWRERVHSKSIKGRKKFEVSEKN